MDNNFKFPLAFASKRKKLDAFDGLSTFSWDEITSQEVIGNNFKPGNNFRDSPF